MTLARFILAATTDLSEDESYYWLWSTRLAASYYDHPPMVAYWIKAGTLIFGQTAFGVRFAGVVSAVAGSWLLYRSAMLLFHDRGAAALCVIWLNMTIFCNAAAIVATPDTPLGFFVVVLLYALAKLIDTGRGAWWFGIGAALGLAFISKYTSALLLPGLLLWLLGTPEGRRWFWRPEPYLGALVTLAVIAPVVYWNYAHDWVSFAKQARHGVKDVPANALSSAAEFLGGQAGLASPLIFLFCVWGMFQGLKWGFRERDPRLLLPAALSAPAFAFFVIHSFSQKIQPNWPGFIYPAAILAAVGSFRVYAGGIARSRRWHESFRAAPWVGGAFVSVVLFQLGTGALPLPAKTDPTTRLRDWAKLGESVEAMKRSTGAAFVLTMRYAITGELAFYTSAADALSQVNERIRYANLPPPNWDKLRNAPALLVLKKGGDTSWTPLYFKDKRFITALPRGEGARLRESYDIYLLTGYLGGLPLEQPGRS